MKKSNTQFVQFEMGFCHKLIDEKIEWAALAIVFALTDTWFNTGRDRRHLNPFPLKLCDVGKWGLTRWQKYRALKFLIRVRLIAVDRRDSKNPMVILAWVPRYSPKASTSYAGTKQQNV